MGPHSEATARWWRLCGIWEFARRFPVAICGGKRGIQPVAAGGRVDLVTPWAGLAKGWPNTWRCFFYESHADIQGQGRAAGTPRLRRLPEARQFDYCTEEGERTGHPTGKCRIDGSIRRSRNVRPR
jgi:hypothetical protein